ncbi:hypothetical protein G6F57_010818 [Rhizopus arrhizus]|uniref:UDP-N-acetylglucosamine transferase subunit ALG13 n=1 Tax=Rhizopus oryzae TaxID=64495 RepID=A0A9P6X127_RHIOR|nr:hypothetical protein G6F23_003991 [Rhizopus arrhizus]KAG1411903.1 hypothetical protein G6F58_008309 [Rhizopus delemar]KAG0757079.1 hypothetical protein G6F24_010723 [Rhizopus arrhizus]KAG0783153.1 hypothetical protein G6F21_010701 [Rhizopus arrhizus]KAG0794453.1 hypothetical protein G6F22_005351 [Rhizopus arrhizus]
MDIEGYRYKSSITNDILAADIIISHAGSGTMLQTLRLSKKLIVVVNESLMDNHQYELAQAMHEKGYAILSEISDLTETIQTINQCSLVPFPDANETLFASIVDQHIGL